MLTGAAKIAGVMGWPVAHSLSPRLHGYWLREYGIDGAYIPMAVPPEEFPDALRALPKLGFAGTNVTLPHKEAAYQSVDETDEAARRMGAVNTVTVRGDGRLVGSNTDGFGFLESIRAQLPDWRADQGSVVLLGAGGAAHGIAVALADAGATDIRLVNRTPERAVALAERIGGPVSTAPWAVRAELIGDAAMLVNTTSLGMTGKGALDMSLDELPAAAVVYDIVYNPLQTPLLAAATGRGNMVVDGLGMLLHQARPGFEAWFGHRPEVTAEQRAFVLAADQQ